MTYEGPEASLMHSHIHHRNSVDHSLLLRNGNHEQQQNIASQSSDDLRSNNYAVENNYWSAGTAMPESTGASPLPLPPPPTPTPTQALSNTSIKNANTIFKTETKLEEIFVHRSNSRSIANENGNQKIIETENNEERLRDHGVRTRSQRMKTRPQRAGNIQYCSSSGSISRGIFSIDTQTDDIHSNEDKEVASTSSTAVTNSKQLMAVEHNIEKNVHTSNNCDNDENELENLRIESIENGPCGRDRSAALGVTHPADEIVTSASDIKVINRMVYEAGSATSPGKSLQDHKSNNATPTTTTTSATTTKSQIKNFSSSPPTSTKPDLDCEPSTSGLQRIGSHDTRNENEINAGRNGRIYNQNIFEYSSSDEDDDEVVVVNLQKPKTNQVNATSEEYMLWHAREREREQQQLRISVGHSNASSTSPLVADRLYHQSQRYDNDGIPNAKVPRINGTLGVSRELRRIHDLYFNIHETSDTEEVSSD